MIDVDVEPDAAEAVTAMFRAEMTIDPKGAQLPFQVFAAALNWELKRIQTEALVWWREGRIELNRRGEL